MSCERKARHENGGLFVFADTDYLGSGLIPDNPLTRYSVKVSKTTIKKIGIDLAKIQEDFSTIVWEILMKRILFAAILLGTATLVNANETNFSYTTLGVEAGSTTLGTPICSGASCISNFTNFGLSGSYQFNGDLNWLVLSLGSEAGVASLNGVDLTVSVGSVGINFVKAISDTVDIGGGVASLSSTVKACIGSTCVSVDDTGVGYFIGGNAWLNDAKNVSASIDVRTSKYSKDTTFTNGYGLAVGYYATKNHAVSASYSHASSNGDSASSVMVGYAYHF